MCSKERKYLSMVTTQSRWRDVMLERHTSMRLHRIFLDSILRTMECLTDFKTIFRGREMSLKL
jgi:hypothetical protein